VAGGSTSRHRRVSTPGRLRALAETRQGFVAVATTLLAFGATEIVSGYGFLAVFRAAVVLRSSERQHEFHGELHTFTEQIENLLVVGPLLLFGGALVGGVLDDLTWPGAGIGLLLVFVVRPRSGPDSRGGPDRRARGVTQV
jgi:NhaP-type Na+/H+ and K+/H+ antiporter